MTEETRILIFCDEEPINVVDHLAEAVKHTYPEMKFFLATGLIEAIRDCEKIRPHIIIGYSHYGDIGECGEMHPVSLGGMEQHGITRDPARYLIAHALQHSPDVHCIFVSREERGAGAFCAASKAQHLDPVSATRQLLTAIEAYMQKGKAHATETATEFLRPEKTVPQGSVRGCDQ